MGRLPASGRSKYITRPVVPKDIVFSKPTIIPFRLFFFVRLFIYLFIFFKEKRKKKKKYNNDDDDGNDNANDTLTVDTKPSFLRQRCTSVIKRIYKTNQ